MSLCKETQKRVRPKLLLIVSGMMVSMVCQSPSLAVSPREDFATWYHEWVESVPQNYTMSLKEYSARDQNKPSVMTFLNWVDSRYQLCIVTNADTKKNYRLLVNPYYAATIETPIDGEQVWTLGNIAFRGDDKLSKLTSDFGTNPDLLYPKSIFDKPHTIELTEADLNGKRIAQVVITFEEEKLSKPREPQTIIASLDESVGWMPIEIRKSEFGGIKSRKLISGWHEVGDGWLYQDVKTFVHMPAADKEVLHSTQEWTFADRDTDGNRRAECFLRFYGLPEPAGSDWPWRVAVFVVAAILAVIGYILIRRSG